MGMNDFAPYFKINGCFIVRNVTPDRNKTIKIFNYPIIFNTTRDLLQIPGIAESDIRASLLKGELNHKIRALDIIIECSDIDLLQFNNNQKTFLQNAGIINGLDVSGSNGITSDEHEALRQLIHFIDEGPTNGFASGAYKVIIGQPFPTSIVWYTNSSQSYKIVEKLITYNVQKLITNIVWNMFDTDGVTIIHSVTDSIAYTTAFESTRTRAII